MTESPSDDYDDFDDDQKEQLTRPIWAKEYPQEIADLQKESVQQDTPE